MIPALPAKLALVVIVAFVSGLCVAGRDWVDVAFLAIATLAFCAAIDSEARQGERRP